ncbi:hypothetical protein A2U01_0109032, partial [Trifolium medium]|nr:hypothetical protein [Trifolium medium]
GLVDGNVLVVTVAGGGLASGVGGVGCSDEGDGVASG